jgi:L-lactate dehydrogenase complex protein LldE
MPEISQEMVNEKVADVQSTGAQVLISCDPGCLMNIGGRFNRLGKDITIMHLAEVLNSNVDMSRVRYVDEAERKAIDQAALEHSNAHEEALI